MASASKIEWTDATWNPFAGCAVLSPGCTNCYAMKMAARLDAMGQPLYKGLTRPSKAGPVWRGTVRRASDDVLLAPLRRRKPTTYFVNSMSDLFYELFDDALIDQMFAVMALCPQHTFQVLTKRAERMREYLRKKTDVPDFAPGDGIRLRAWRAHDVAIEHVQAIKWPLPNVWLGVSCERQQEFDERWPHLRDTPAAVRFISYEPALGPLDIARATMCRGDQVLDWLICGGESGPNARPMNPQWARGVRDQCKAWGVAFFHKQNGEFASVSEVEGPGRHFQFPDGRTVRRVGKKAAGRLLDGIEHNGMPKVAA